MGYPVLLGVKVLKRVDFCSVIFWGCEPNEITGRTMMCSVRVC